MYHRKKFHFPRRRYLDRWRSNCVKLKRKLKNRRHKVLATKHKNMLEKSKEVVLLIGTISGMRKRHLVDQGIHSWAIQMDADPDPELCTPVQYRTKGENF